MSHLYPLALTAANALKGAEFAALSLSEAKRLAGLQEVLRLETDWLTLPHAEAETAMKLAETEAYPGVGFIQRYEDASGAIVLAVTYWKLAGGEDAPEEIVSVEKREVETPVVAPEEDHTDDLYFRAGRTKKRGRTKKTDPNQMDLFGAKKDVP